MRETDLKLVARSESRYREIAYQAIKDAILSGQYETEKPLVEETLAGLLNISRTPVREALVILEHEGLIGPRGRRGLYVRPITRQEFIEIFNANEVVETELARQAALLATEDQIQVMEATIQREKYYGSQPDLPKFFQVAREFLRQMGAAAGNQPLTDFVVRNRERIDLYLLNEAPAAILESLPPACRQHGSILNAILRRDPEQASRLVIYHSQWLRERCIDIFSGSPDDLYDLPNLADF